MHRSFTDLRKQVSSIQISAMQILPCLLLAWHCQLQIHSNILADIPYGMTTGWVLILEKSKLSLRGKEQKEKDKHNSTASTSSHLSEWIICPYPPLSTPL